MKTRDIFRLEEAAPMIAPPKPGTKPAPTPVKRPVRHPNPFKDPTKRPRPGEEPDPKMCPRSCRETAEAVVVAMLDEADIEQWTSSVPDDPGTTTYMRLMQQNMAAKGQPWTPEREKEFRRALRYDPEVRSRLGLRWPAQERTAAGIRQREREQEYAGLSPAEKAYYDVLKHNFEIENGRPMTAEEAASMREVLKTNAEVRAALRIR